MTPTDGSGWVLGTGSQSEQASKLLGVGAAVGASLGDAQNEAQREVGLPA